jgi:hypothetical protein
MNFDENLYFNIFNYQKFNLQFVEKLQLVKIFEEYHLNLEEKITLDKIEIIKYLSCFFTKQKIIILNLPLQLSLREKIVTTFPKKFFIFLKNEI